MFKKKTLLGVLLLLSAAFIWGVAFIPTRFIGEAGLSPFLELFIRNACPFIIFGTIFHKKIRLASKSTIKNSMLVGSILFVAILLSIYGIRMIEFGSTGILLISIDVILVPLFFVLFKKKFISPVLLIASFLSLSSSLMLAWGNLSNPFNLGVLLCLLASFGYSAYIIMCSKVLDGDTHPIALQFYQSLTFMLWCIPFVLIIDLPNFSTIDWTSTRLISSLLYIGLLAGTIGYQLYFFGQRISSPTVTALILSADIIFAIIADILLFDIQLNIWQVTAYTLIVLSVFSIPFQEKSSFKFSFFKSNQGN